MAERLKQLLKNLEYYIIIISNAINIEPPQLEFSRYHSENYVSELERKVERYK